MRRKRKESIGTLKKKKKRFWKERREVAAVWELSTHSEKHGATFQDGKD